MKKIIKTIFVMLALLAGTAEAAVCTSLSNGNWNTDGSWSCGHVPNNTDDVVIAHNITMNTNPDIVDLTINAGATLDDNGNDLAVTGSVLIDGTYDGSGNNGNLIMKGNGQTLSGTGTIIDIGRIQIDANTTIPAGSNLNLTLRSEIRVGDQNNATLTIDGIITGTTQSIGNRILRLDNNNAANVILNGTINAPNSYVEVQSGGTFTNNGTVTLRNLDGNGAATATWTQGVNSSLTLSQATQSWSGIINSSAVGNTMTFNGTATPFNPETYYNLAGTGVTCPLPAGITVLGSSPCMSGLLTVTANPTLCVNDTGIGTQAWSGLTNVTAQDNVYATAFASNSQITNYLKCTGYNFAIPAGATITGITVGPWVNATRTFTVNAMQLVKTDVIQPTNLATGNTIPNGGGAMRPAPTQLLFGNSTNLWGNTWAPTDINAPTFGAAFAAQRGPFATSQTVGVDAMPITVAYNTGVPAALAEYRFDEIVAGVAADSSGNGLNGSLIGGVSVGGTGKVCSSYNFNGTNAFVSVPHNALLNRPNVSLSAWVRHLGATMKTWEAILAKGDSAYRLHLNGGCSINTPNTLNGLSFGINGGCNTADIDSGTVPVASRWYHVVGTYDGTTISIYVDGALAASAAYAGAIGNNTFPLYIGENSQQTGRYWSGDIDEVKIFGAALTATQVATIYANENAGRNWDGSARSCSLNHLEIQHASGTGLTCAASTLTIVACADNANPCTPYTAGVAGTLSATGTPAVNWDGSADFTIPSGSSSVTKNVQVATAGTVTFGISSATPSPINGIICNFGSNAPANNNCEFTVSTAGFIFSDSTTGGSYTIPVQVSGTATPTAPAANAVYLRAVQASTTDAAVCTPAIINTADVTMGYACNNPSACTSGSYGDINGTAIAATGTAVNLTFDANGSAPIAVRYDDVGSITLSASKTVSPFVGSTPITLNGNSNAFVVKPGGFVLSAIKQTASPYLANPAAADATGNKFVKAGEAFSVTVNATTSGGATTPNYGKETTPESVKLTPTLVTGLGLTNNPALSGSFGNFGLDCTGAAGTAGTACGTAFSWGEVGIITLTPSVGDGDYLGAGDTTGTVSGRVGRFYPDHFDTIVAASRNCTGLTFASVCPGNNLAYSGQQFSLYVYAMNTSGVHTQNYVYSATAANNFAQTVTLSAVDSSGGAVIGTGALTSGAPMASSNFGIAYGFTNKTAFTFSTSPTGPTDVFVRAVDAEGVSSLRSVATDSVEGGLKEVSGRIKFANAYGSELLPLSIATSLQYYNGTNWVIASNDSVSAFNSNLSTAGGNIVATIIQGLTSGVSVISPGTVIFSHGSAAFRLAGPGIAGIVDLSVPSLSGVACDNIVPKPMGCFWPGATGRATFGVYKNNNNFIYRRESY